MIDRYLDTRSAEPTYAPDDSWLAEFHDDDVELAFVEEFVARRLLNDRRAELSQVRTQTQKRLQRLMTELMPNGVSHDPCRLQAEQLLATLSPRTLVAKTLRRMAFEEIADLAAVNARLSTIEKELGASSLSGLRASTSVA